MAGQTSSKRHRVGVLGASGYAGGELLSLLAFHPEVELVMATAHGSAGKPVGEVHRNLRGLIDLTFAPHPRPGQSEVLLGTEVDTLFLALPHGESMALVPHLPDDLAIIDLGADYRLSDPKAFQAAYGTPHVDQAGLQRFHYGLPEVFGSAAAEASRITCPGCFATAAQLALYPLVAEELLTGAIFLDGKTGSSGSGNTPKPNTHHPEREGGFFAYKLLKHQHQAEISQMMTRLGQDPEAVTLQVHSAPMVRGIFLTLYGTLVAPMSTAALLDLYRKTYRGRFFVRILKESPDVAWVCGTNFADLTVVADGRKVVVFCAIDNLRKGAAGQAIQNFNLMRGLNETTGLMQWGGHPA